MDVADHWHGLAYNNLVCEVVELLITCCRRGRGTPTDNTSYRHQDYSFRRKEDSPKLEDGICKVSKQQETNS
ncbi:hypothetical protein I305_05904 [Cryptococcus gattii E566]|uniref:Uncharacterized protein n=2 Tax=Cryptococcus gattii TaxID=37769 RepID=E6REL8_CRYGW|nr:Hypothetical Protein CGB_L0575C [Cryptococcus gattii WM276]ADV25166.1 Hypothetical Protein CGB_L0575C [Cryptococcus gattii WM276]KIR76678.1 hypothetical protein I306_06298 [Cryptococcus gattii EJB2]KIY31663.1 hypothetical protein I305_05904 [Cryptococcus gattii E566]KJE01081.1 hypothetical protein I311_05250 [Cryptococcus gattii NT-10]